MARGEDVGMPASRVNPVRVRVGGREGAMEELPRHGGRREKRLLPRGPKAGASWSGDGEGWEQSFRQAAEEEGRRLAGGTAIQARAGGNPSPKAVPWQREEGCAAMQRTAGACAQRSKCRAPLWSSRPQLGCPSSPLPSCALMPIPLPSIQ